MAVEGAGRLRGRLFISEHAEVVITPLFYFRARRGGLGAMSALKWARLCIWHFGLALFKNGLIRWRERAGSNHGLC